MILSSCVGKCMSLLFKIFARNFVLSFSGTLPLVVFLWQWGVCFSTLYPTNPLICSTSKTIFNLFPSSVSYSSAVLKMRMKFFLSCSSWQRSVNSDDFFQVYITLFCTPNHRKWYAFKIFVDIRIAVNNAICSCRCVNWCMQFHWCMNVTWHKTRHDLQYDWLTAENKKNTVETYPDHTNKIEIFSITAFK